MRGTEGGFGGKPSVPLSHILNDLASSRSAQSGCFILFYFLLRLEILRAATAAMLEPKEGCKQVKARSGLVRDR